MLVQFSAANFLSFDEEQVLSMVATGDDQHSGHLVPDVPREGEALLRAAAVYGANGAGKSNFVQALAFARNLIVQGTRGSQTIPVRPFRLGGSVNPASKFEFIFRAQGILYNYGFRVEAVRVLEEWLFATPEGQEVPFFERSVLEGGTEHFEFGQALTSLTENREQFLHFVAQGTRPNQLFLTEALERNVVEMRPVTDWFAKSLLILSPETPATHLEMSLHEDKALTHFTEAVLRRTGTGVEGLTTEEVAYDLGKLPAAISLARERIEAQLAGSQAVSVNFYTPHEERLILKRGGQDEVVQVLLRMSHRDKQGQPVPFSMEEESEGTRRLINLIPALFLLRKHPDQVVILDELERRLHPFLSRFLVQSVLESDGAQRHGQLIFTTHDTNLLDLDLLRRDEVWFVEKDAGGASHLYSLAEFKSRPQPDRNVEKGYLNGRYGALPFITGLGEEEEEERAPEEWIRAGAAA